MAGHQIGKGPLSVILAMASVWRVYGEQCLVLIVPKAESEPMRVFVRPAHCLRVGKGKIVERALDYHGLRL